MFKSLFLLLVSFTILFGNSIATDNYYILLEKKRIESLNNSVKFSFNSANNDFTWGNNSLNIRNSRFINLLEHRDLNYRDQEILLHLEKNITKNLVSNNENVTCENIVTNTYNTIGITRRECINLEIKIKNYYESSFYNISIPNSGWLNKADYTYKNLYRLSFKDRNSKSKVFENIKKIARENRELLNGIKYMDVDILRKTCDKIMSENTILSKSIIASEIVVKATNLGALADDIRMNCTNYDFTLRKENVDQYPALTVTLSNNLHTFLGLIVADLNTEISTADTSIVAKQSEITTLVGNMNSISCPLPPGIPVGISCVNAQIRYNNLTSELNTLQTQKVELENSQSEYQDILDSTSSSDTVVGITKYLEIRAIENYLFDFIKGINRINFYINKYIMTFGTSPSKDDLKVKYNSQIDDLTWPKSYNGSSDILFNVDMVNYKVTYSGLNIPIDNPSYAFDANDLFKKHLSLKQKSIIDGSDIIIPLDNNVITFINKIVNRPMGTVLGLKSDNTCSVITDGVTLYQPNGSGFFDIYYCDGAGSGNWLALAIFDESNDEINLEDKIYLTGKKVYSIDGLVMRKNIIVDNNGNLERIKR